MKNVKEETLEIYLNDLMTVFAGFENQLPEDKNNIEGISLLSRLNPFICKHINGKVTTSSTIFSQSS